MLWDGSDGGGGGWVACGTVTQRTNRPCTEY